MVFEFGFSGDDIDAVVHSQDEFLSPVAANFPASAPADAFPIPGKPQLPPRHHPLTELLSLLPSKIAFNRLEVDLDDGSVLFVPRRELWDVRVQLMAEEEGDVHREGLGEHDVKTGIYEGGFKSWESSVDLIKVLASENLQSSLYGRPSRIIELGCGTALPSIAVFQRAMALQSSQAQPLTFVMADYNPSVLQLITLPNFLLAWAFQHQQSHATLEDAFSLDEELEITPELLEAFKLYLLERKIQLSFISGGWCKEFIQLLYSLPASTTTAEVSKSTPVTLILGAETIYSPFALQAFTETVFALLSHEQMALSAEASAFVAAKRLYFGVGGSLDDFVERARGKGGIITWKREETAGVARGVVHCHAPTRDGMPCIS
ncbi:hypothetical protein RJ55_08042 [Drechmeria coniospora]|nr:hypothetical protein RJ55_08042 [Drechmeria coniospora]